MKMDIVEVADMEYEGALMGENDMKGDMIRIRKGKERDVRVSGNRGKMRDESKFYK